MAQSKKFRGVRQRHWGSWVSEIRHPLLKRKVWLGTYETAEQAAKAYDEAAILMSGRNARTNFPIPAGKKARDHHTGASKTTTTSSAAEARALPKQQTLSSILSAKLRKSLHKAPSASLTCLRLDTENSQIGVWQQKGAAACSDSSCWVMTVELGSAKNDRDIHESVDDTNDNNNSNDHRVSSENEVQDTRSGVDDDESMTLQMIEELLNSN